MTRTLLSISDSVLAFRTRNLPAESACRFLSAFCAGFRNRIVRIDEYTYRRCGGYKLVQHTPVFAQEYRTRDSDSGHITFWRFRLTTRPLPTGSSPVRKTLESSQLLP
jgi:hypothetical protein